MFFCAHAVFYFKLLHQEQETFLVHENVYLIDAEDAEKATQSALLLAKSNEDANEDGHLELNEQKAAYLFVGLRKVIEVEPSAAPVSALGLAGLELTYSEFEVDTMAEVLGLARGDMVDVLYRE